ncbi:MAG: choice-of-anchor K domain-containing protein [Burkholderiales bacterium]|nr:choice-of-anchor K domain-containing protein [Burkholderiales bacterium]
MRWLLHGVLGVTCAGVLVVGLPSAGAAPLYTGTVAGTFLAPRLAGEVVNTDGSPVALDNSLTAVHAGFGTPAVRWGFFDTVQFPGVIPPGVATHIELAFTGNAYSVEAGADFVLGVFTYANGASSNETLVFGADLALAAGPGVAPATIALRFVATVNGQVSALADTDVLAIDGLAATLNVFEGGTASAALVGRIDDAGQLGVSALRLLPANGDGSASEGVIARGPVRVPEPATTRLLAAGARAAAIAAARRRRRAPASALPRVS